MEITIAIRARKALAPIVAASTGTFFGLGLDSLDTLAAWADLRFERK